MGWRMSGWLREPDVCERPCEHHDCATQRRFIAATCVTCGAAIGEDAKYYRLDDGTAEHAACRWRIEDAAG